MIRAIAWATMVGVVGGKEQPNTELVPQSIALRWWSVEKSSQTLLNGVVVWWQSSTERSGGDGGVVRKKEGSSTAGLFIADKTCDWWLGVTMVTIKYRGFAKISHKRSTRRADFFCCIYSFSHATY